MIKNIYALKPFKDYSLNGFARQLKARRISANMITAAGLMAGLGAAVGVMFQHYYLGLILLAVSISADLLDGVVARLEVNEKFSGKIFDAVCDRLVELAWIAALIINGRLGVWGLALAAGSVMLLICRCLAYRHRFDSSAVIFTRFERLAAITGVTILPWHNIMLIIYFLVTVGTWISCWQIIGMIYRAKAGIKRTYIEGRTFGG
jgi:phosphatidylglycerophosphate synthase